MSARTIACLYVFASDSSLGITYQALQYTDATTSCECKGWTYKRRNTPDGARTCKHTRWIDLGMAEQHAVKIVRYAEVTTAPRRPIQVSTGGPSMRQGELKSRRNRVIILD